VINRHAGLRLLVAVALIVWLPACGSDTIPPPPPPPTPTALPPFEIFRANFPPLDPGDGASGDFSIPSAGTVTVQMDWTFASNRMFIWVFAGLTCEDFGAFLVNGSAPGCTVLGQDLDPNTKPARFTFNATAGGGARVFVLNGGPTGESGNVLITLQR
jgi:hypothetical protein